MSAQVRKVGQDFTDGPIMKMLVMFALPMMLTNLIQQLYSTVDLIIVGQYVGSIGTSGVNVGGQLSDLMTPVASAVSAAGQIYISQLRGAHDEIKVKGAVSTILTFMMVASVICMVIAIGFANPILGLLNCPQESFSQARSYMVITAIGLPLIFGYNAVSAVLRGLGESKKPLIFVAVAAAANVFGDLFFVMILKMEAAGSAIATVLSQLGAFAAAAVFMNQHKKSFDFELKLSYFKIKWQHLRPMLLLGVPQLIRTFCIRFSMIWVNSTVNSFGLVYSSTYAIDNKLEKMFDVLYTGVSSASSAVIGQNLGARKIDRVKGTMNSSMLFTLGSGAVCAILCLLLPKQLFGLFTKDPEVLAASVVVLRIMALQIMLHAAAAVYKAIGMGSGAAGICLAVGVLDGLGRILVCAAAVYILHLGALGVFWGSALCHIIPGVVSAVYYYSGKWKTNKLLSER